MIALRLVGICLLMCSTVWCQQDMGVITGVVTDASGAAVPDGGVTVVNAATNETFRVLTSGAGAYTVGPLRVGVYDVTIEKAGFSKSVWKGIELHAEDRVRADFKLQIGQVSETIAISSRAPLLQVETSSLSHVVEQREIGSLPINGRNFQKLAWLSAGVQPATRSRDSEAGFNSHGQAFSQNNFQIDGVDNSSHIMGINDLRLEATVPSMDAVAEFKLQTSNYSAEFGRNSGAVMIVNIKSGSNQLHGSAYESLRNNIFDARDTFNYVSGPQVLRQHSFGATLGGPVRRNKTFFFGSWEGRRQNQAQSPLATVPTADERTGLFSPSLRIIRDPGTGQPFPDNQIPRSSFDPTAAALLPLWPQPNFTGSGTRANFISAPPFTITRDQIDTRVDHNISSYDRMFVRFSATHLHQVRSSVFPTPARGDDDAFRNRTDTPVRNLALSFTHVFNPTFLYEFRYGLNRQVSNWHELTAELLSDLTAKYGIRGVPGNDRLFGLPRFALSGPVPYTGLGEPDSTPNIKISQVHQFVNTFTWNKGNHNLRFGHDIRFNRSDADLGTNTHGNFTFDGNFTNISFADFLLGRTASASLSTWLNAQIRFRDFMFFFQDDWKVTPRLTVNLGLRYELDTPWYDKQNHMNTLNLTPGAEFGKIVTAGHCGDSYSCRGLVNLDTNNWAPRVGVSYQLAPRTVFRGGFGIFYGGQGAFGANGRGIGNFPFSSNVTLTSTPTRAAVQLSTGFPADLFGDPNNPPPNLDWRVWQTNFPLPTVAQWNFALQRELMSNLSLTVAYVGSGSSYVLGSYNWNGSPVGPPATEQQRRRIPQWNSINLVSPYGHSTYHGMDAQLERRYAGGLSLSLAYTWSHSIDNVSEVLGTGGGGIQDFRNLSGSRGSSNFDYRHHVVVGGVYDVPFARRNRILGGWQATTILAAGTGHHFNVSVSNARQRLGASGVGDWRADRIADGTLANRTADLWFDKNAFVLPRDPTGAFYLGNGGRNVLTGDGPFNLDVGVLKTFRITERLGLQFRAEAFNLSNTPSLGDPNANIESPDFGKVRTTVNIPRQFQFALRLVF